eukprot:TRINITY_DN30459_c0_g1_i1.p1 TRINITY_DN30459_c0_g1~~TRINITY_DN30459_c0_g1_i1.p1  ORF type:complete len:165 (+),score=14.61 TRINITY_DN30459_c0_g1_i1:61-495(+)
MCIRDRCNIAQLKQRLQTLTRINTCISHYYFDYLISTTSYRHKMVKRCESFRLCRIIQDRNLLLATSVDHPPFVFTTSNQTHKHLTICKEIGLRRYHQFILRLNFCKLYLKILCFELGFDDESPSLIIRTWNPHKEISIPCTLR